MKESSISVLRNQIKFYNDFIKTLKNKDGIDKNTPQQKLDNLIIRIEKKIKEFEIAIDILTQKT